MPVPIDAEALAATPVAEASATTTIEPLLSRTADAVPAVPEAKALWSMPWLMNAPAKAKFEAEAKALASTRIVPLLTRLTLALAGPLVAVAVASCSMPVLIEAVANATLVPIARALAKTPIDPLLVSETEALALDAAVAKAFWSMPSLTEAKATAVPPVAPAPALTTMSPVLV